MDLGRSNDGGQGAALEVVKHRFRHGFAQLFLAFQAVRRDPFAWKRYLRVCLLQSLVIVAVTAVFLSTAHKSSEELRERRVEKALQKVTVGDPGPTLPAKAAPALATPVRPAKRAAVPKPPKAPAKAGELPAPAVKNAPAPVPAPPAAQDDEDDDSEDDADQPPPAAGPKRSAGKHEETPEEVRAAVNELQTAILDLAKQAGETVVRRDKDFQESRLELDKQFAELERTAEKVRLSEQDRAALVRLGGELDVLEQRTRPGFWDSAWALILSIYGTLSLIQAGVIALSRDYHVSIARDASLLLGVAPEDPPMVPRVRINIGWIRRKLKQRTRTLLVFLPGLGLIWLAALPFPYRASVSSVLTALWAAYWWVVWTASKSARAWEGAGQTRPPWFLRLWHRLTRVPLVGWIARSWEAIWMRVTRPVFSPTEAVEQQPLEFAGLAAARALQLIPLVKLFVRPLVPVASARLLAERVPRADLLLGAVERETLAARRAAVPASPDAIRARDVM